MHRRLTGPRTASCVNSDNGYRISNRGKKSSSYIYQSRPKGVKDVPSRCFYTLGLTEEQQPSRSSRRAHRLVQNPLSPTLTNSSEDLDRRSSSSSLATKLSKVQLRGDSKPPRRGRRPVTRKRPAKPVLSRTDVGSTSARFHLVNLLCCLYPRSREPACAKSSNATTSTCRRHTPSSSSVSKSPDSLRDTP